MILDTSFIIDLMDEVPEAIEILNKVEHARTPLVIPTPAIFELWSGLARSSKKNEELRKITKVLESQIVAELDEKSAQEGGRIDGTLCARGEKIDITDAMIAGIAIMRSESVLTRNIKHFSRTGAKVVTY